MLDNRVVVKARELVLAGIPPTEVADDLNIPLEELNKYTVVEQDLMKEVENYRLKYIPYLEDLNYSRQVKLSEEALDKLLILLTYNKRNNIKESKGQIIANALSTKIEELKSNNPSELVALELLIKENK